MENTIAYMEPVSTETAGPAAPLPYDAEAFVSECTSDSTDETAVYQKLMDAIAQAQREFFRVSLPETEALLHGLFTAAKGLRKYTADCGAFRFFYFGEFQAQVEALEQSVEQARTEQQIELVASKKHFASIMQLLYVNRLCRHKDISTQLGINKSNLTREMQHLADCGLVYARERGKSKYYSLTPRGCQYYNTYLSLRSHLEEQYYAPAQDSMPLDSTDIQFDTPSKTGRRIATFILDGPSKKHVVQLSKTLAFQNICHDSQNKSENPSPKEMYDDDDWQ